MFFALFGILLIVTDEEGYGIYFGKVVFGVVGLGVFCLIPLSISYHYYRNYQKNPDLYLKHLYLA